MQKEQNGYLRRGVLKGAAGLAGAAAGSGLVRGFPTIWAQNIKDVELLQVGESFSTIADIARQAQKDLGFKITYQVVTADGLINRAATQPQSFDIGDFEFWMITRLIPLGVIQPVKPAELKYWEMVVPLFTKGENPDGKPASRQGTMPYKVQYVTDQSGKTFANKPTDFLSIAPTIYNADTLGVRPDLVSSPVNSWADLLKPEFDHRCAIVDIPSIGIMDAAMALEARGDIKYADKGDMTRAEIDKTIAALIALKRQGHWRAFWNTFDQSVNLMASGEVVIQSMWSPAVTAVRSRGVACTYQPLREGYRGWGVGLGLMNHVNGIKRDAAIDYFNWYLSGWQGGFIAKQGYYSSVPETAKKFLTQDEWDYWYDGKPARVDIKDPYGNLMEHAGAVRDGGSYQQRMDHIACWNTVMKENQYMIRKWNEFVAT
jgi:putative spermidine/putrescine transport system substrate-binding protein